jgi:hypothetical protein
MATKTGVQDDLDEFINGLMAEVDAVLVNGGAGSPRKPSSSESEAEASRRPRRRPSSGAAAGDDLDWLFGDEAGSSAAPPGTARSAARSASDTDESLREREHEEGLADGVQADAHSELLTSLSAELQLGREHASTRAILQLCKRLGALDRVFRASVWLHLLGVGVGAGAGSGAGAGAGAGEESPLSAISASDEGDAAVLTALAESAALRSSTLDKARVAAAAGDSLESALEAAPVAPRGAAALAAQLGAVLTILRVGPPLCDPGAADVVLALSHPGLRLANAEVAPLLQSLQQHRVLLLQFPESDATVPAILSRRSALLDAALGHHDADLAARLLRVAPSQVFMPWRWWRCAFAGEVPVSSLLPLWDQLIIDALPESSGEETDEGCARDALTGVQDGCDPRGALVVYVMLALLLRAKERLLGDVEAQQCVETLRALLVAASPADVAALCDEARILRASTPIGLVRDAMAAPRRQDEELHEVRQQQQQQQQNTRSVGPAVAGAGAAATAAATTGGAAATTTTASVTSRPATIAAASWLAGLGRMSGLGGISSSSGSPPTCAGAPPAPPMALAERVKLTFGIGDASAAAIAESKAAELRARSELQAARKAAVEENLLLLDVENDGYDAAAADAQERAAEQEEEERLAGAALLAVEEPPPVGDALRATAADSGSVGGGGGGSSGSSSSDREDADLAGQEQDPGQRERRRVARTKLKISGLREGSRFSVALLRQLGPDREWQLIPVWVTNSRLALLLVAHFRLVLLDAVALDLAQHFAQQQQTRFNKEELLEVIDGVGLVVRSSRHLSEVAKITFAPAEEPNLRVSLWMRADRAAERMAMRSRDVQSFKALVGALAAQLYC